MRSSGFSLLEVTVCLVIIGISATSSYEFIRWQSKLKEANRLKHSAQHLADTQLQWLMSGGSGGPTQYLDALPKRYANLELNGKRTDSLLPSTGHSIVQYELRVRGQGDVILYETTMKWVNWNDEHFVAYRY